MAQVIWARQAGAERIRLMKAGEKFFGPLTALNFSETIDKVEGYLSKYPTSGYIESLLEGLPDIYRAYRFKKWFKLIYVYDEVNDIVIIVDIWDTRRAPSALVKRIVE